MTVWRWLPPDGGWVICALAAKAQSAAAIETRIRFRMISSSAICADGIDMTMRNRDRTVTFATLVCALLAVGCAPPPDWIVTSPDGHHRAVVRNHWTIDPPDQSIRLDDRQIKRLAGDQDWCNKIVWSHDSSTVAYLVQDARLIAVAAGSGKIVADRWLVDHRDYPPREMACQLALS